MISVAVSEASQVSEARRQANLLGQRLGFDDTARGRLAIIVTELSTNILKYGDRGEVLIGTYEDKRGAGIDIVAIDKGPGLSNIREALRDGHSTGGSAGTGLGAVARQSQFFDVVSWPNQGTAVLARVEARADGQTGKSANHGGVAVPVRGELVCGDAYAVKQLAQGWVLLVVDGLGHGLHAAEASAEAVRLFQTTREEMPTEILRVLHSGMRHTRGAAATVAMYDPRRGVITVAGIGNVAGAVVSGGEIKRTVSLSGTIGHVARRFSQFEYIFSSKSLLIMCSDGIGTNWTLDRYPGLVEVHPTLIASIIYRDFRRERDDASVLVARGLAA